jgi:hypothetical protein
MSPPDDHRGSPRHGSWSDGYSSAEIEKLRRSVDEDDELLRFPSPEAAALHGWRTCPIARARVVSSTIFVDQTALVVIDTEPSHPDHVECIRVADGWVEVASGS